MSSDLPVVVLALALGLQFDPKTVDRPAADEFAAGRFSEFTARFNEKMRARCSGAGAAPGP